MNENSPLPTLVVNEWLQRATAALSDVGIPSARLDAELILAHTLRQNRTYLHAHPDAIIDNRQAEIADARLSLRLDRVPVAYIIGHKEFYGRRFHVTNATLIPRPESEALIELLKKAVPSQTRLLTEAPLKLVDVGTGSGALGLTAKLLYPELDVTLIDNSRHALKVAEQNAAALHTDVTILRSDLLASYPFVADIIIANLPYVDPEWERSPETNHEPAEALFAHKHGLALILELLIQTKMQLVNGGHIILEADPVQHPTIIKAARENGLLLVEAEDYGLLLQKIA